MKVGPVSCYPVSPWHRSIIRNKRLQNFKAPEFKYGSERVTLKEISKINKCENKKVSNVDDKSKDEEELTPGKWINDLYSEKVLYGQVVSMVQLSEHTENKAKEIVNESIHQSERATDWAIDNEYFGNIAAQSALVSLLAGLTNSFIQNLDMDDSAISPGMRRTISVVDTSAAACRGYTQFEKIYGGRMDDDRARNKYESEAYGNKVAGLFSDLAYIFETNINPVALVALNLLNDGTSETIRPLLSLCNSLWWRVRMLAEIDQKFGTDLFTYLTNKPLALMNIKSAVEKIKKIKDSGCFTYEYVGKRLIELSGLDSEKHKLIDVFPEVGKLFKTLFNENKDLAKKSSENLGKFLGPIFGLYGFVAYGVGVPVKSILSWLEIESKWVNLIAKSGSASQQLLYLFRIYLPEQFDNSKQNPDDITPEKLILRQERNRLFYKQATVCAANTLVTMLQLIDAENSNVAIRVTKSLAEEVADKGINYVFSDRRKLLGKKYRLDNPELYNIDGTIKIISDKVKIYQ